MNEISTIKDIFQEDSFMESFEKIDKYIFENTIKEMFFFFFFTLNNEVEITSVRHKESLMDAENSLNMVLQSIEDDMSEDFFSIDLMNCYSCLGRIIGEEVDDDLVNEIFAKFCMGK